MYHFLTLPERLLDLIKRSGPSKGVLETLPHTDCRYKPRTTLFFWHGPGRGVSRIDEYETGSEVWSTTIDSEGNLRGCDSFILLPEVYRVGSSVTKQGDPIPIRRVSQYLRAMAEELARVSRGGELQVGLLINRHEIVRRLRSHLIGFGYAAREKGDLESASQAFKAAAGRL